MFDRGNKFALSIQAYEFPEANDELDANWLVVGIEIEQEDGVGWRAHGPYLRTRELVKLLRWLQNLTVKATPSRMDFMEGELAFDYTDDMLLGIKLDFSFHPKGAEYDYLVDRECSLYFRVNDKEIADLIFAVEQTIKTFPER
ncbi:WapI family immunity protein [Pseudomonas sp. ICMP 8385]|uniref:WapI family immunity protein n=1 Tax=Pseudomonas sp. ICMP 8385 TaxID=1718920 RepID=UPI00114533B0|nr:hypothetical protein [Pseudomonas sp. ICMP 8385]